MKNILFTSFLLSAFSLTAQQLKWTAKCHSQQRETYGVAYSADGNYVLSGSECHPASIRLWNAESGSMLWDYNVGNILMCQMGVKMSTNGTYVGSMEEAGNLIILQTNGVAAPTLLYTLNIGSGGSRSLDFSADNVHVAVDGNDDKVKIYNIQSQILEHTLTGHTGNVLYVSYSPDGTKLLSGSADNTAKLWDTAGNVIHTFPSFTTDVVCVKFAKDGSKILIASKGGLIKIFNSQDFTELHSFTIPESINQVDLSNDNEWLVAGGNTSAFLVNVGTGSITATFNQTTGSKVYTVAFHPLENEVVIGNSNGDVSVFSVSSQVSSVSNLPYARVDVFPNPASDYINITGGAEMYQKYEVLNNVGQVCVLQDSHPSQVNVSTLPAGLYYIRIHYPSITITRAFSKK